MKGLSEQDSQKGHLHQIYRPHWLLNTVISSEEINAYIHFFSSSPPLLPTPPGLAQ